MFSDLLQPSSFWSSHGPTAPRSLLWPVLHPPTVVVSALATRTIATDWLMPALAPCVPALFAEARLVAFHHASWNAVPQLLDCRRCVRSLQTTSLLPTISPVISLPLWITDKRCWASKLLFQAYDYDSFAKHVTMVQLLLVFLHRTSRRQRSRVPRPQYLVGYRNRSHWTRILGCPICLWLGPSS
jgi:hypothetical protein